MASYPMIGALGIICCAAVLGTLALPAAARAATTATPIGIESQHLYIDVSAPPASTQPVIPMGTATRLDGATLTVDGVSLLRDGRRWLATMGEFHYSRYPQAEWRDELLKMKAGGIEIVASYIFWIHHEEIENQWDFTGRRDLRMFVQRCGELGIPLVVRCGPWGHGEVRNGAFPEWLLAKNLNLRSDDPKYLDEVRDLYAQIAKQLDGLLWKDGGPVIGVQLDNEYPGAAQHLLTLKKMARDVGLDTPIYTRTGWPELTTKMPFGEILPLHGGYAEGFWDREITPMPGKYWEEFTFKPGHGNAAIATEQLGQHDPKFDPDDLRYPYLTCELGGGMMTSYHRRVKIDPRDIVSVPIVKVGTGSNLPGYYMYHGGTNPPGKRTTLNEAQATKYTNYNDLPVKTYDFQAPLGEFGQVRPHYHLLRRLHLFLHDFGSKLAPMPAFLPTTRPADRSDAETVRWAVRSDGDSGFVFVNNYERLRPVPAKSGVRFEIKTRGGTLTLPAEPVTVPADETFYWPFNLDLGGAKLVYATAEPVCGVEEDGQACSIFAETPGVAAEFVFSMSTTVKALGARGEVAREGDRVFVRGVRAGRAAAFEVTPPQGKPHSIVLLDRDDSLRLWKARVRGAERVFHSDANLLFDGDVIRVRSTDPASDMSVRAIGADGEFRKLDVKASAPAAAVAVTLEPVRPAGPPRQFKIGAAGVAEQPSDADFDRAAVWRVKLPGGVDPKRKLLLRVRYSGDVARLYLGDDLLTDNFYNGTPFDLGLWRHAPATYEKELLLKILPLRKDAPIYLADDARPKFAAGSDGEAVARIDGVEVIEEREAEAGL